MVTGIISLVAGVGFAVIYSRVPGVNTTSFVHGLGYALSLMCLFMGAQMTSDSISREKREGTLGLLLLTPMGPWQVIAGKLVANGLSGFFGVMVTFPLLSLAMIAGGVALTELVIIAISLLNTLFVSASIGMLTSSFSFDQKRATGRATSVVMLLWWGLPLLAQVNGRLGGPGWLSGALLLCSFNSTFLPSTLGPPARPGAVIWLNLLCTHIVGWLCLGIATLWVARRWQERPASAEFSFKSWWKRLSYGGPRFRRKLRSLWLDRNPFVWLASRDRLRFLGAWIFTFAILGLGTWIIFSVGFAWGPLLALCVAVTVAHRFVAAAVGSTQLMIEQEQGTLEMLLSTPLSPREILRGQFQAALRQLRGPIGLVLLLHLVSFTLMSWSNRPGPIEARIAVVFSMIFYLFDLYTALWLSMWGAVSTRTAKQASGAAIARLLGIPFFIALSLSVVSSVLNFYLGFRIDPGPALSICIVCAFIVVNNLYWLRRMQQELPQRLCRYAFLRYEPAVEAGFFAWLGRHLGTSYRTLFRRTGLSPH